MSHLQRHKSRANIYPTSPTIQLYLTIVKVIQSFPMFGADRYIAPAGKLGLCRKAGATPDPC